MLTIFIETYTQMWWRNLIFGIFHGFLWGPCNRMIALWFPPHERFRYTAIWLASAFAAYSITGPIGLNLTEILYQILNHLQI